MGGIETFTKNLATTLAKQGNKVTVVTNDTNGVGSGISHEDNFDVMRLPCIALIDGRLPLPIPSATRMQLIKHLEQMPFDGVLVNTRFYPHSLLGMKLATKQGIRPLVLDHGSAYLSFGNKLLDPIVRLYEKSITRLGKRYNPAYYGVSAKSAKWLEEFKIYPEGVIPNSIDARAYREQASIRNWREELRIDSTTFLVVYAGKLLPAKGLNLLLETIEQYFKNDGTIHLAIAGAGPMEQEVKAAASVGCNYTYVGRLSSKDLSSLFKYADCLCLPTKYPEGLPTVLLEAAAQHTGIVVSDCAGAREVIPNDMYGIVLDSLSPETIAKSLSRFKNNRNLLELCSRNAAERVEKEFSLSKTAALVETQIMKHNPRA